jgi:hypothetical protein
MARCTRCGQELTFGLTVNMKRMPLHRLARGEYAQLSLDKLAWHVYRLSQWGGRRCAVHVEPHVPRPEEVLWLNHMTVCRENRPRETQGNFPVQQPRAWDEIG